MQRGHTHVVQLRLSREEWRLIAEMARLRRVTVEDMLREGLRLPHRGTPEPERERTQLRLVRGHVETPRGSA